MAASNLRTRVFASSEIRVTSRRSESREELAERLRAVTGTPVRVTASAEEAFDGANILVEATRLTTPQPLLHPGLVRPGAFVVPYWTILERAVAAEAGTMLRYH